MIPTELKTTTVDVHTQTKAAPTRTDFKLILHFYISNLTATDQHDLCVMLV